MQADSEARIALLRKRAKKGKSKEEDQAEKALEQQLQKRGRATESTEQRIDKTATVARNRDDSTVNITTEDGHCTVSQQ